MAWDEWERLKTEAAERHATGMRLDGLPGEPARSKPGGGEPDLLVSDAPWTSAAQVAGELRTSTNRGLTELRSSDKGIGGGTEGFDCTAALQRIQPSWEARLEAVREECDHLHGLLRKTGKHFGEVDHGVKAKADSVKSPAGRPWAR
ncbi:amino acid ABC transporter permease [Streptomyces physcomitrii]|uniref:amino acid ABC transporter permease n=1 Tax=Streptomyces physcomitrii TaxID=2724184 RepID=UPI0033CA50B8